MNSFQNSIPPEALPRTFREAIQVIQLLGIFYLWIDCLCIIQDDFEDWKIESDRMTTVYGNSSLNIAASGANHGGDGLFFTRNQVWQCQFTARNGQGLVLYNVASADLERGSLESMPLTLRGWAVQERILP